MMTYKHRLFDLDYPLLNFETFEDWGGSLTSDIQGINQSGIDSE